MRFAFSAGAAMDFNVRKGSARRALWTMLRKACKAGALAHLVFLLLFLHLGLPMLVWVNIASIALFICSWALLSRRRNGIAMSLIVGEVVVHAILASGLLGWESGFHYYLLTMVGPLMVGMSGTTISKLVRLLAFGIAYAALDAWTRQVPPVYRLERVLLDGIRYLNLVGMLAIMAFVSLTYSRLMASAENALHALASTDSLTGLHNRRHLLEIVQATRAAEMAVPGLFVLLCDIDHFKRVNDRHGHEMGDIVLQRVAAAITSAVRSNDSVARWGGEEFVVLLPGADVGSAMQTGERVRRAVAALSLYQPMLPSPGSSPVSSLPIPVTITIGIAHVDPAEAIDAAIARADAALYRGKAAGRDRVVADGDAADPSLAQPPN